MIDLVRVFASGMDPSCINLLFELFVATFIWCIVRNEKKRSPDTFMLLRPYFLRNYSHYRQSEFLPCVFYSYKKISYQNTRPTLHRKRCLKVRRWRKGIPRLLCCECHWKGDAKPSLLLPKPTCFLKPVAF